MKNLKAVFFDLDGTLIDSKKDISASINDLRNEFDLLPLTEEEVISNIGNGAEYLLSKTIPEISFNQNLFDRFIHFYKINTLKYSVFYDGALDLLEELSSFKRVLITNKSYIVTMEIIKKFNLENTFEIIYGGDSLPERKPSPYPIHKAMQELNLSSDEVLYFGDSLPDYSSAINAGVYFAWASYGYGNKNDFPDNNYLTVNNPLDLASLLKR